MNFFQDVGFLSDALRFIFSGLDNLGYFLLDAVYDIFFTVSNANIFQGTAINTFYSRIQLILGVFMIFMLSIAFLQMIVNPDLAKDKQKGAGSLVKRIAVSLVLLTLIVPVTIEDTNGNPLNEQINSNGILFGFLYQIQNTVIQDNVLGKLVLGSNSEASNGTELSNIADVGSQMAATVAKAFIRPALGDVDEDSVTDNDTYETNVACPDQAAPYFNSRVTAGSLVNHVNDTCDYNGNEIYVFDYAILGGLLCSIIMVLIILGFTIDVAVRAVKLAILRLIAPIPIISYISPGQEKDGAFNNWVKTLTSTYISLFVRLIIIYFGIYLIIILTDSNNDFSLLQSSTSVFTSFFATIFIIIGILMFMKEAPKFFQDMFGLKGDGKLFSGVGTILGAAALTGGLAGSAIVGAKAGWQEGQEYRDGATGRLSRFGRGLLSVGRAGAAGLAGGIGGAYAGGRALMTSDKKVPGSVYSAMQKQMARRAAHSTVFGRGMDKLSSAFTGSSPVDKMDAQIEGYNTASDFIKNIFSQADADGDWIDPETGTSVKALKKAYENIQNSGAPAERVALIRQNYEEARDRRVADMMDRFNRGEELTGNFAPQMGIDYKNLLDLVKSRGLELENLDDIKGFKAAQHISLQKARNVKNTTKYNARKANQTYSKQ